jgi:hypothetical protein
MKILAAESCGLLNGNRFYVNQKVRHVSTLRPFLKKVLQSNKFYDNFILLILL